MIKRAFVRLSLMMVVPLNLVVAALLLGEPGSVEVVGVSLIIALPALILIEAATAIRKRLA
ncbi:hypothetical protein [Aurantimonas coralicida]|uniref:hypothetical protein n=1 Tax=Aurantimonas coralicida TaxID=182270 RepID=UPI001D190DB4|nr:hypothetical protein [Aurantimonas coralicida]MCC4298451.1 hypothetical protein [Aurantimonas coralicida]